MLYYAYNKELGSEDAYGRVLDGKHRDLVKSAFKAMIQADSVLRNCPRDIHPSLAEMSWGELRDRIITAHKPIDISSFVVQATGCSLKIAVCVKV